jgi:uncharacterized membrane protein YbhN (UPF0104 family)
MAKRRFWRALLSPDRLPAGVGLLFGVLFLWLATRKVDWAESLQVLQGADRELILLALLVQCVSYLVGAARWQALFTVPPLPRLGRLVAVLLVAQLVNVAFPVRLGPLVRAFLIGGEAPQDKVMALATVAGEKVLDLLALAVGGVLILVLLPIPTWVRRAGFGVALAAAAGLAAVLLVAGGRRWLERWLARFGDRVTLAGAAVLDGLVLWLQPGRAGRLALWTLGLWSVGALVNWVVLLALGLPSRFSMAAVLLVLVQLGVRVPGAAASIGIFESLCIVGLGWFGIEAGQALGYGLVLHAIVLLPGLIGGVSVLGMDPVAREGLRRAARARTGGE